VIVDCTAPVSFNGEDVKWASTITNKAESDATIKSDVVVSSACLEWRGVALSPTGRRFGTSFRRHQSNDCLWDNCCRSALSVKWTACLHNDWVLLCCCELGLCLASSAHNIVRSLGAAIIARLPIPRSITRYCLINMNPRSYYASYMYSTQ